MRRVDNLSSQEEKFTMDYAIRGKSRNKDEGTNK